MFVCYYSIQFHINICVQVDLVEQDKHFLEKARDYLSGIDH